MKKAVLGAMGAVLAATMACSIFVGGPSYPEGAIQAFTPDPQTLQDQLQQALATAAQTGVVTLQLTQSQLTIYLAQQLALQTDPFITDPLVVLQAGQMQVFGKATSGIFTGNVSITLAVTVDSDGQPLIQVTKTDFGPLSAPQGFNDALAASVREAFTGWLGPVATGFRLENITIGDGVMTVSGRIK